MIRQGYAGTSVDQICAEAGVTKGGFFHYFPNKEQACRAAMEVWSDNWEALLETSKLDQILDPLDRLLTLFDVMEASYPAAPGCLVGTISQELSHPNEPIRDACQSHFDRWVDRVEKLIADAKAAYPPAIDFDPRDAAWFLCTVVQGTMLILKSHRDPQFIVSNVWHMRAYVESLFLNPGEPK